jgi:hypothetical protein
MIRAFFILALLLGAAKAFAYDACGQWVHLSNYGQSADAVNFTYECKVVLNCNSYETLSIVANDSATAVTTYYVPDWTADTLTVWIKHTVPSNSRDSVYVSRVHNGTAPSGATTFMLFADFETDVKATKPVSALNIADMTRNAIDTSKYVPVFDTTGTTEDGYREIDHIIVFNGDTICFGTSWTGVYGSTTKYLHLWKLTNNVWSDEGVIPPDSAFNGEQAEAFIFSNGDSLGVFYEASARADGYNQVGFTATADLENWTGFFVAIDSSYIFGGSKSPSSPACINSADTAFFVAVEVKGDEYIRDGVTHAFGGGAIYLYQGDSPRTLERVVMPHIQEGDTLVPFIPFFEDSTWGDSAGVSDEWHYWDGLGWVLIAHVGYTNDNWAPFFAVFDSLPWSNYDYEVISEVSGPGIEDSLFPGGSMVNFWNSANGLYSISESAASSLTKVYLYKAAEFDTASHTLSGWNWVRVDGGEDALGYAGATGGTLKLMGEQTINSAMGLRSASALLSDSFEVIVKMRTPDRTGTPWPVISIGSGALADQEGNGTYWQVPGLRSGVIFHIGDPTSRFYDLPSSGGKENLDTDIASPTLDSWAEWRLRHSATQNNFSSSRWQFYTGQTPRDYFTSNANGEADDYIGDNKYLQITGGTSGSASYTVGEFTELDYVFVRKIQEVDLFGAPGVVTRDSIPITEMNHTYQSTSSNNLRLNWGADTRAVVGNRNASFLATTLAHFSMASVPDSCQIISAIAVFADSNRTFATTAYNIGAYRLTQDWVEGTLNGTYDATMSSWLRRGYGVTAGVGGTTIAQADTLWTTPGGTVNPVYVDGIRFTDATTPARTTYAFDITEFARYWQAHPTENFGFALKETKLASIGETANQLFHSDDYATASLKPYVLIYYADPDVTTWSVATGASADANSFVNGSYRNAIRSQWGNLWR